MGGSLYLVFSLRLLRSLLLTEDYVSSAQTLIHIGAMMLYYLGNINQLELNSLY